MYDFSPFFEATEASRQQQQSPVNTGNKLDPELYNLLLHYETLHTVNNNGVFASNSEESTATATATSNNNAANKRPLGPINLYDPIQQHPAVVPHLHTSSGEKYALPSPKLGRANKHADNATAVNKVRMSVYIAAMYAFTKTLYISQPKEPRGLI